jgi:broad specificity phosphatase PhoE
MDYAALAKRAGAVSSLPPKNYTALAKQAGAVRSEIPTAPPSAAHIPPEAQPHATVNATSSAAPPTKGAGESGEDIIRGSVNIPLSPAGEQQAHELAARVAAKGGFDSVMASDLTRARQTGELIAKASGVPLQTTDSLHPMYLGSMEGQPTSKVLAKINDFMLNHPDEPVPGRSDNSTKDGESFNSFADRLTGFMQGELNNWQANPTAKAAYVTHFRDLRAIESWIANNGRIDPKDLTERGTGNEPGSVHRIYTENGQWKIQPVNMNSDAPFQPGVYVIRHGVTAFNGENPATPGTQVAAPEGRHRRQDHR